jgi:rhamnulokinase
VLRFPNEMCDIQGHLHWDVARLFDHVKTALKMTVQEDLAPDSIGVDTWGVDFALLAADGRLLGPPFAYRDRRTDGAMESFFRKVLPDRAYELTGSQFLPINTLFQLESMVRDRSPLLDEAHDLLFIPDFFHYALTGVKKTEFTIATTSQMIDISTRDWSDELIDGLPIRRSMMQDIVPPGTILGVTTPDVRQETGLAPVPLVAVATHDTASAVAAAPMADRECVYISSGTWSLMGVETDEPVTGPEARRANFTNEGGIGGTYRALKNIMGLWLLRQCRRSLSSVREIGYDELIRAAEDSAPFAAFIDPDRWDFLNPTDMPEAVRAFCRRTAQPVPEAAGAIARCVLESLAMKYRFVLERIRRFHPRPIRRVHVIGGGARNRLLCRFAAEATGLPVHAGPVEATAIGNLLVQAMALGKIGSLAQLRRIVAASFPLEVFEPREPARWDDAFGRFVSILDRAGCQP